MKWNMRSIRVLPITVAGLLLLAGCAETQLMVHTAKKMQTGTRTPTVTTGVYKVGQPYQIKGIWYYPREDPNYDQTGIASWYGDPFHGRRTANGAIYDMNALTAAHKTLPMPTTVRVTNLENGRSLVLTVNDRGPFVNGRIIDVSRRAANLLGFERQGTAKVRVTAIEEGRDIIAPKPDTPREIRTALPAVPQDGVTVQTLAPPPGVKQATRIAPSAPPPTRLAAAAPRTDVPITGVGEVLQLPVQPTRIYVQAGAFLQVQNAHRLAVRLNRVGPTKVTSVFIDDQEFFRVRVGPLTDVPAADRTLQQVLAYGQKDAKIVVD